MSSIAVAGYGFGAAIWIPIETAFVNPDNIEAVPVDPGDVNSDKYFEDPTILSNVPKLFLLLGGMFASLQIVGLSLIRIPPKKMYPQESSTILHSTTIEQTKTIELSIKETISRKTFWLLWTIFVSVQLIISFVVNYQKTYGLKFINDDVFFSYVGLASSILNGISRIIWGKIYDWKGFRVSYISTIIFDITIQNI